MSTNSVKPLNPRNLLLSFYRLIKNGDVHPTRFHDLRHTVACLMLAENINPKIIKEILGHFGYKSNAGYLLSCFTCQTSTNRFSICFLVRNNNSTSIHQSIM
ncbi:tyrosine-type recombinase/integrase [Paenibacillus sp. DS2363]|uniref:tyrosine-type recombinase/integrase n=1 Tax=Paenibacillus sp. DS2363 TaxID=3156427 RepID=UPI00339149C8